MQILYSDSLEDSQNGSDPKLGHREGRRWLPGVSVGSKTSGNISSCN